MTGETPATAIAGLACSAAVRLFGLYALRGARAAMGNREERTMRAVVALVYARRAAAPRKGPAWADNRQRDVHCKP